MAPSLSGLRRRAAARGRGVQWPRWLALGLAAIFLIVQLLTAAHHDHEVAAKSHCAACALHAQPHAAPPDTVARAAPVRWTLLHALACAPGTTRPASAPEWLLPPAHAPPVPARIA